ncbi:HAD-IIA family hydrolase [Actinopolymorpha sp. B17G11]|uniref:HAD-IIA family hydrolase n=1 Tax=Actinopolymorpha sp. B17G11 TaxID=3160861 RepID=UPI0032E449C2
MSVHQDGRRAAGYAGIICDLDGTVYLSGRPLPGAVDALNALRAAGVRVAFVSNNPLRTAESYAERLTGLGVPTGRESVVTSGGVMASWLRTQMPGARVLLLGETSLRDELRAAGAKVVERGGEVELVVASFDRTFRYETWLEAFRALRAGARFVATNPDRTCPVDGGEVPDAGGIIAALETSTRREVEAVMGKPSPLMLAAALDCLGLAADQVLVVGDRLETDVELGHRGGLDTALVLTGVTDEAAAGSAEPPPTYVLPSLADLPALALGPR